MAYGLLNWSTFAVWDQVDFRTATLHVRRVKQGTPSTHPILGDELRALRRLQREQEPKLSFIFTSERGAPFTTAGFARMVERAGIAAKLGFKAHPHMLRHACGYALANRGHDTRHQPLVYAAEDGSGIAALVARDYPTLCKPVQHGVRQQRRIPALDHWPRVRAIFLLEQSAGDRLLNDPLGHFDGK